MWRCLHFLNTMSINCLRSWLDCEWRVVLLPGMCSWHLVFPGLPSRRKHFCILTLLDSLVVTTSYLSIVTNTVPPCVELSSINSKNAGAHHSANTEIPSIVLRERERERKMLAFTTELLNNVPLLREVTPGVQQTWRRPFLQLHPRRRPCGNNNP